VDDDLFRIYQHRGKHKASDEIIWRHLGF